jgi:hypothetical protein
MKNSNKPTRMFKSQNNGMEKEKWWIAINGASCARCTMAVRGSWLTVIPTPELLVGFPASAESLEAQRFLLEAPIPELFAVQKEWQKNRDITIVAFEKPGEPGETTQWIIEKGDNQ